MPSNDPLSTANLAIKTIYGFPKVLDELDEGIAKLNLGPWRIHTECMHSVQYFNGTGHAFDYTIHFEQTSTAFRAAIDKGYEVSRNLQKDYAVEQKDVGQMAKTVSDLLGTLSGSQGKDAILGALSAINTALEGTIGLLDKDDHAFSSYLDSLRGVETGVKASSANLDADKSSTLAKLKVFLHGQPCGDTDSLAQYQAAWSVYAASALLVAQLMDNLITRTTEAVQAVEQLVAFLKEKQKQWALQAQAISSAPDATAIQSVLNSWGPAQEATNWNNLFTSA